MKEWYLIRDGTKPNMLGGYENQSFLDYKEDAFSEVLETDIATTALLYNSDLSIQKEIRCIIEGNVADTQLQSIQRKGLFVRGTVKDGMYIFFDGGYWLITGFPGTNGIYEKATMSLCQFKLRWQNSDGKIIERWAYTEDFTKYSNGLTGNNTLTIGDNQYGLTIPIDDETKKLKRDMRFPIDFDDSEQPDIYKLTNRKAVLNDNNLSGHGGTMLITMSLSSYNNVTDKRITLNNGDVVWICDYKDNVNNSLTDPNISSETAQITATISGNLKLKNSYERTYTVSFNKKTGEEIDYNEVFFEWNVVSDFKVEQKIVGNRIILSVDNENYIGRKITLQVIVAKNVVGEVSVSIVE